MEKEREVRYIEIRYEDGDSLVIQRRDIERMLEVASSLEMLNNAISLSKRLVELVGIRRE